MPKYTKSKVLARMAEVDRRIKEYEFDEIEDHIWGHWLYLTDGWFVDGIGSVHEYTVREAIAELRRARLDPDW